MKTAPTTTALLITGILAATGISSAAYANTTDTDTNVATEAAKDGTADILVLDNIKISGDAKIVLSNVHNARLALFEGQTDAALKMVETAQGEFRDDLAEYTVHLEDNKGYVVPIDYSIEMAEDFKPTEQNAQAIAEAGREAQKGNTSGAVRIMKAAGVDLSVKYAMLPAAKTMAKLDKVQADLKDKKFYEANLTLKSIETSMMVEDFELSAAPKQGHNLKDIL